MAVMTDLDLDRLRSTQRKMTRWTLRSTPWFRRREQACGVSRRGLCRRPSLRWSRQSESDVDVCRGAHRERKFVGWMRIQSRLIASAFRLRELLAGWRVLGGLLVLERIANEADADAVDDE